MPTFALEQPLQHGYAVARTDGGHEIGGYGEPTWALRKDGSVDETALTNFAHRSIHDMAVAGKAVTASYYGREASFKYYSGCSTGGRQGYRTVQQYPDDFDGIFAAAPAINWSPLLMSGFWGQVVMREKGAVRVCVSEAFRREAVRVCDVLDGVIDGVIGNIEACMRVFQPNWLVGKTVDCGQQGEITVTATDAQVIASILDGPKFSKTGKNMWYSITPGTNFAALHGSQVVNGTVVGTRSPIASNWIKYFLKQDPEYDVSNIGYEEYEALFNESVSRYDGIMSSNDPDISAFRDKGGKFLSWHGLADELIPPQGTAEYRTRVEAQMGGNAAVNDFYRLFVAPGVAHCAGGSGHVPVDPLGALVDWVEKGRVPETLLAVTQKEDGRLWRKNLCSWPLVARHDRVGDPSLASSYSCEESYATEPGAEHVELI